MQALEAIRRASRPIAGVTLAAMVALSSGCATAVHGTSEDVPLGFTPPATRVSVLRWTGESVAEGESPHELEIPRPKSGQSYLVKATHDGYCPRYFATVPDPTTMAKVTGWTYVATLGLLWAVIMAVDSSTGGGWDIDEKTFSGPLAQESSCPG